MQLTSRIICAGKIYLEKAPRFHLSTAYEIEYPWRTAKVLIIRGHQCEWCEKSSGFQIGFWGRKNNKNIQEHLAASMGGRLAGNIEEDSDWGKRIPESTATGSEIELL